MDPVTHGLVGATVSQSFTDKAKLRSAALTGFASALLADADIFISSASDPLLNIEMHRHFMHSFLFAPVGALIASGILWWLVKKKLSYKETYLFSFLGYVSAILMDYVTSYGVHLFWPFGDERYSLDIISVFDPVFTLGILILTALALFKYEKRYIRFSLIWIVAYLSLGLIQQNRALKAVESITDRNAQPIEQIVAKPTIANQLLWSVRYISRDTVYSYGVRLMPFTAPKVYPGESTAHLNWQDEFKDHKNTTLYSDIQRFSDLSEGWLIRHPEHDQVIGDARYSMLPTTLSPLWGITADTANPDQHVEFDTYRNADEQVRQGFLDMLLGKELKGGLQ